MNIYFCDIRTRLVFGLYITLASDTVNCIEQEIFNYFLKADILMDHLIAIGCNEITVNVSKHAGIIQIQGWINPYSGLFVFYILTNSQLNKCSNKLMAVRLRDENFQGQLAKNLKSAKKDV